MINKPRTRNGISMAGFTMMEIMVTLIIVAILTAVAMPVYNKTIDEMHKKEAKTAITKTTIQLPILKAPYQKTNL